MKSLALLVLACLATAVEVPTKVIRIVDGDTLETEAGKVRLLWMDTPEVHDNGHGEAQREGKLAAMVLASMVWPGAEVRLWGPGDKLQRDRYDRQLALLTIEGRCIQEVMIQQGWSVYWQKYGPAPGDWHGRFVEAQALARRNSAGCWGTIPKWMADKENERTPGKGER